MSSYFNSDQEDSMKDLAAVDRSKKSWCGWYYIKTDGKAECAEFHGGRCATHTCADKCMATNCYGDGFITLYRGLHERPLRVPCTVCGGDGFAKTGTKPAEAE